MLYAQGHLLVSIRGQLGPRAACAQSSYLQNLGSGWLDDHQTKLMLSWPLQKPLCPLLALLISKKHEGLGLGHICEPDGTTGGEG